MRFSAGEAHAHYQVHWARKKLSQIEKDDKNELQVYELFVKFSLRHIALLDLLSHPLLPRQFLPIVVVCTFIWRVRSFARLP